GAPVRCPSPCSCLAGRERPELLSRLAPLNPPASGARDVPARSGSECNRRLGEDSSTSRLSEPLRPGTGRAPKDGSWAGRAYAACSCKFGDQLCSPPPFGLRPKDRREPEPARIHQKPADDSPSPRGRGPA